MPVFSVAYRSSIISKVVSSWEATDKTSSQILLSRSIAEPDLVPVSEPRLAPPAMVASIFEDQTSHIMTIGDATPSTSRTVISGAVATPEQEQSHSTGSE